MGVEWGNGEAEGPMPQWLARLFTLILGLAQVAPLWRAPEVRVSDLDAWPLLPTLGGRQLVYMAHRALLLALPAPFLAQAYAQHQQRAGEPSSDSGQGGSLAGGGEAASDGWSPGSAPVGLSDLVGGHLGVMRWGGRQAADVTCWRARLPHWWLEFVQPVQHVGWPAFLMLQACTVLRVNTSSCF
jgi:hypothetical protein